ncbi:MAG: SwmB domain-containing protein, partial [Acidimicrobiaceae bacterium]|nr:SwmB domain-containing protein [Acidimicrobiaceae bacterium]
QVDWHQQPPDDDQQPPDDDQQPPDDNGNRAPVFGGTAELTNTAPPGFLVSLTLWQSDFTDPDGDPLTFEISTSRDDVVVRDGITHNEQLGRLFFEAKTACALLELNPSSGEVYETTVTMTATDPDGATATATRIFRTDPTWNTSTASLEDVCPEVAGAAVDGATLVISLDGAVATSIEPPTPAEFTVTADGAAVAVASVRRPVRYDTTITLELAEPLTHGQTVTVSYTPGDYPIAAAFADQPATNNTPKPPVPVCVTPPAGATAPTCAAVSGNDLIVTFSADLAPIDAATAGALRFSIFVDGAYYNGALINSQSPGRIAVDGNTLTLTLGTAVRAGDVVTIHYSAPSTGNGLKAADTTPIPDFTLTVTTTAQT